MREKEGGRLASNAHAASCPARRIERVVQVQICHHAPAEPRRVCREPRGPVQTGVEKVELHIEPVGGQEAAQPRQQRESEGRKERGRLCVLAEEGLPAHSCASAAAPPGRGRREQLFHNLEQSQLISANLELFTPPNLGKFRVITV